MLVPWRVPTFVSRGLDKPPSYNHDISYILIHPINPLYYLEVLVAPVVVEAVAPFWTNTQGVDS